MNRSYHRGCRRGSVLVAALVCLAIIVAMIGSMLVAALTASRQLRAERDLRQCELLLQAAADRASNLVAKERDYRGETWNVSADKIIGSGDGKVTIELSSDAQDKAQLTIIAEYPVGSETSIRRSRTISFLSTQPTAQE